MQRLTHRHVPACTRAKWVSHRTTLLSYVLTRDYVLLSFVHALAHRVVKNFLKHHEKFTMAILCKEPATIILVNMVWNHSGLLQESWPDSSSDTYVFTKKGLWWDLQTGTKIYRNKWVIPDSIGFASGMHFISRAIDVI